MHEVIVFEVGLTPFKTNKENISTLQQLEGKKMLLLGMPALFSAKEVARKHKENVLSHAHHCVARGKSELKYFNRKYGKLCWHAFFST